jgi:hypothetical protein
MWVMAIGFAVLALAAIGVGIYMYNQKVKEGYFSHKPHRSVRDESLAVHRHQENSDHIASLCPRYTAVWMKQPSNRDDCIRYCKRTLCAHTSQSPCNGCGGGGEYECCVC